MGGVQPISTRQGLDVALEALLHHDDGILLVKVPFPHGAKVAHTAMFQPAC